MKTGTIKTISWKFRDVTESYPELVNHQEKITSPERLYENFHFIFDNEVQEMFVVFWLSTTDKVIGYEIISRGSLNASVVHPREVFRGAIVSSCASIIVAHNHPSGNPEPSNEDIQTTKKLVEAGKIIDINVFDHIIFAQKSFTSMSEKRLI
jgi:DNA repair protein RadC